MRFLRPKQPVPEALFALDSKTAVQINPWECYLKGWFVPRSSAPASQVVLGVVVDGLFVPAVYGLQRPDVARDLNDSTAGNSGFYVRFRSPKLTRRITLATKSEAGQTAITGVDLPMADLAAHIENYQDWLLHRESGLFWAEDEIQNRLAALPYRPLISIILAVFDPDLVLLKRCVQSVLGQQYHHWQLCIADAGTSDGIVPEYLANLAADKRISFSIARQGIGVAEVQNLALRKAEGDFVVLLDPHDELHPGALLEVVKRLNEHEDCSIVYSDEDRMDSHGARSNPAFKPDFDGDMLLAYNYVGRLAALKRSAVLAAGGFRSLAGDVHEWDLLVRLHENQGAGAFQHIAKPLYHRGPEMETHKPDVGGICVISDHIERSAKPATVEPGIFPTSVRLKYFPSRATVAIFVRPEDGDFQVQTVQALATHERPISIHSLADCAVPAAEVVVFINRPLETLNHSFVEELVAQALRTECGLVTGISVDVEGRTLHTGLVHSSNGHLIDPFAGIGLLEPSRQFNVTRAVETISDEFFAVRREHLAAVGGLTNISLNEMPRLVYKLIMNAKQHGMRVIVTPFAVATFSSSATPNASPVPPDKGATVSLNPNLLAFKGPFCGAFK